MESFGKRLTRIREKRGLNQTALATRCGWTTYTRISNYENDRRTPDLDDIITLADALRVTPHELAFGDVTEEDSSNTFTADYRITNPAGKTMVIPAELAEAVEDLLTAWATSTVTKRQLHAYRTMFRADANIEPPPALPKEKPSPITTKISQLKDLIQPDDTSSH